MHDICHLAFSLLTRKGIYRTALGHNFLSLFYAANYVKMTIYQLRRLHVNQNPQSLLPDETILLYQTTKIGRNPDLVDVVLISQVHSNMISREHTTIFVKVRRDRYVCFIKDHSLNGTYVNDFRVSGEAELQQGDVIKFGHVNGAAIKPGCYGPQTSAEFTFLFEEAPLHRLNDRRRPITIMGNVRQDLSSLPSQIATDTSSFIGTTGDRLRAMQASEQASSPRVSSNVAFQMAATAAAAGACSQQNGERNSRFSGLEELTEDLLEDCGPPKRAPTPASSSSELPTASTLQQESHTVEESKPSESLHSSLHQSPKRRGHGHSDSSCSPAQTPIITEQKVEPKRRRKNNEVAMLLNDLTEVAWHHLARKSTNKITMPTQTRKVYAHDEDDDVDNRSCQSDQSGSEEFSKKEQEQKNITKAKNGSSSVKNIDSSKTRDSDNRGSVRKRGRPKKDFPTSDNVITANVVKKKIVKRKKKKRSSSSDNMSSDSESSDDEERRKQGIKKPQILSKDQPGTSAAEKIERALDMMRKKQQTLPDSDSESNSSSFSSSSSHSPIRRTWGATSQRKTLGISDVNKKKMNKTGRQSRSISKVSRKQSHKGIASSSTCTQKRKGRKKKKRSSSSESVDKKCLFVAELSLETSSLEWEKMKPVVTPLPAAHAPLVFDEWNYHDPEKQCDASSGCKKPQSESVVWVQCDYCCRWYHMECVTEHGVTVSNSDDFNCGCREANRTS
ncbi:unnamed protein product [Onchocerca flexuosa]|uniref:FHA domain-containing protein n=1 Tax=Onchocerca flexuosa TaxID=387005 RepID=A0A183HYH4_9BILA|nr:unnamed protein product [Onchocerca flexuosa]